LKFKNVDWYNEETSKSNGIKILLPLSINNCFQSLFLNAKQTPIPETKNNNGIRQTLISAWYPDGLAGFFTLNKTYVLSPWLKNNYYMID
jgi:hypothetical protein